MALPSIIQKIQKTLDAGVDSEQSVVYLLVQIRKVFEKKQQGTPPDSALRLLCNWALHVDLHGEDTVVEFMERIDREVTDELNAGLPPTNSRSTTQELASLKPMQDALRSFFQGHGLTTELCDEDTLWYRFLQRYAEVIEDGTLMLLGGKLAKMQTIERVTFRKGKKPASGSRIPFATVWEITLQDGRTVEIEAVPLPDGSVSRAFKIRM